MQERIDAVKASIADAKARVAHLLAVKNDPAWCPAETWVLYHVKDGHRLYYQRRGLPLRNGFFADVPEDLLWAHRMKEADADGNILFAKDIVIEKETCEDFLATRIFHLEREIAANETLVTAAENAV